VLLIRCLSVGLVLAVIAGCTLSRDVDSLSSGTCRQDGVQNGHETDIDCGGGCGPCANGRVCVVNDDCASGQCDPAGFVRRCARKCADLDTGLFSCMPACDAQHVCVRQGNATPSCVPVIGTCTSDRLSGSADCAAAYCPADTFGADVTNGAVQCLPQCP
jgi:hypothetical protein